jgi:predicted nucleotidyltransferase
MMDKLLLIRNLKSSKKKLAEDFGIDEIGLFGSYVKGLQNSQSDVDLVFHLKPGHRIKLAKLIELEIFLAGILHTKNIDLVNWKNMNPLVKFDMEKTVEYV